MNVKAKGSKAVHFLDLDLDLKKVPKVLAGLVYRTKCGKPAPFSATDAKVTCKICKG